MLGSARILCSRLWSGRALLYEHDVENPGRSVHAVEVYVLLRLATGRRPSESQARLSVAYELCANSEGGRPDHSYSAFTL